ncbi:MAG: MarR family transcriptional regulator [Micrococcaceae bacterium]|nr:MarR family transcriptional regulator [Micrococcaceae bacterium]MDN5880284.1 MarR family transcriptional regulator [Micrococcaceae bacterium]MDN6170541.1 MarR family transcriptional regulator [Micrococcaceae bacterium]
MESPPDRRLIELLQRFVMATDRYVETAGAGHGMHRTDLNALSVVMRTEQEGQAPTASNLSAVLNLSSPATTALLNRLAASGHITRERNDDDRRVVRIRSTASAAQDGRAMFTALATELGEVIARFDPAERLVLTRFMADASAAVDRATGSHRPETT